MDDAGKAIALLAFSFLIPMFAAMGWRCGVIVGTLLFGMTGSSHDVKIPPIVIRNE